MNLPDVPGLLGFQFGQAQRKLGRSYEQALAPHSITPSQLLALYHVWADEGLLHKELAGRAHLDPTSANWLINQLEKNGWIVRTKDPDDRRLVRLRLTDEGRRLQERLAPVVEGLHNSVRAVLLEYIAANEVDALQRGLAILVERLPEGDDLWQEVQRKWEKRFERLRRLVETDETGGHE